MARANHTTLAERVRRAPAAVRRREPGARCKQEAFRPINRREAIQPAFDALLGVVDQMFPIDARPTY
jgi:hypothetical protein